MVSTPGQNPGGELEGTNLRRRVGEAVGGKPEEVSYKTTVRSNYGGHYGGRDPWFISC